MLQASNSYREVYKLEIQSLINFEIDWLYRTCKIVHLEIQQFSVININGFPIYYKLFQLLAPYFL